MILFRTRDILLVGIVLGLATFTYKVKYEEQKRHAQIRHIERQIEAEQDTINLLKAEWALMSAPPRLLRLVDHYGSELELENIDPSQIVTGEELPQRLPDAIDILIADNNHLDLVTTGSVTP